MSSCAGLALWPEGESALTCTYVRASHAAKAWKNGEGEKKAQQIPSNVS